MNVHMKSAIQKIGAKLSLTKHLAIVLAATGLLTAFPILAHAQLIPKAVYLFNDNPELSSTSTRTVATLTVNVGDDGLHRLVIDYSSVGAIKPDDNSKRALFYLGCFVDGVACIGEQDNSGFATSQTGYVNVLSCDFTFPTPICAAWDSSVNHVWFTGFLSHGSDTVVIKEAVGASVTTPPFGGTGTVFDEARTLVVTVLGSVI
jgi:hypothetical protein